MADELRTACPFCGTRFNRPLDMGVGTSENQYGISDAWRIHGYNGRSTYTGTRGEHEFKVYGYHCPKCSAHSVDLHHTTFKTRKRDGDILVRTSGVLRIIPLIPFGTERPVPAEVPEGIAEDYREATKIMGLSLKGAATMARRCLQRVIREAHPAMPDQTKKRLFSEIQWVIDNSTWDQEIKNALHHLREAGNFGAHPGEDGLTEIYELTDDDLDGCLALLEHLFEHVYVQPARNRERLAKLRQVPVRGQTSSTSPSTLPAATPSTSAPPQVSGGTTTT